MNKVIAYYRVSTEDQNLGIPAQKKTVKDFAKRIGVEILEEFQDKASGSKINHNLQLAIHRAKKNKIPILVAKQDRISRDVGNFANITKRIKVIDATSPDDNPIIQGIKAVMDMDYRIKISEKTKDALAVLKDQGKKLGNLSSLNNARKNGNKIQKDNADNFAAGILPLVRGLQASGIKTLNEVADQLNISGVKTARGGAWYPSTVSNLIDREVA